MALSAPLNIHWEITNECNFNCVQCYQKNDDYRTRLTNTQMLYVARDIVNSGVFQVSLSGGEPFLVPVLYDVIREFVNNQVDVLVCSNGSCITASDVLQLHDLGVPVQISLDSANEEKNNRIRGNNQAFEYALHAIDLLVAGGIEVSVAFCASRHNFLDLAGVADICKEHKVKKLVVGEMLPVRGDDNKDLLSKKQYVEFLHFAKEIKNTTDEVEILLNTNWGFLIDRSFDHAPCTALDRDFAILYNGYVTPCPFIRNPKYYLGNVVTQGIKEIWENAKNSEFYLNKHLGCDDSCPDYLLCMSGCKAEAANRDWPLDRRDIRCIK